MNRLRYNKNEDFISFYILVKDISSETVDDCCVFKLQKEKLFKAWSIYLSFICLPSCHISRFVSLSLFLSLLGSRPPSPFTVLLSDCCFSLFSLYGNISTCQLPPQGRCWRSAEIIKTEIPRRFQLHCICTTHGRSIQFITVTVMVVFSPLSVYLLSENMSVFLWHLMDRRKKSVILKCWKVP